MKTPVDRLLEERCADLGIDDAELARRLPFKNWSKTRRRLLELRAGRVALPHLLDELAPALGISDETLREAVGRTCDMLEERRVRGAAARRAAADLEYRDTFVPHAIWLTERSRPQPIFAAALAGVDTFLRHDFPADLPPGEQLAHALGAMPERAGPFGAVLGVAINASPDAATLHARDGTLIEATDSSVRTGHATMVIGRGDVPAGIGWTVPVPAAGR